MNEDNALLEPKKHEVVLTAPDPVEVGQLIKTLFQESDWMFKTGVGGILTATSVIVGLYHYLLLPVVVACWSVMVGYILRVLRKQVLSKETNLPDWNDWGDLFVSGLTWIAFQFTLWSVTLIISFMALAYCSFNAMGSPGTVPTIFWSAAGTAIVSVSCANIALVSAFLMVHFAVEENSRAGVAYLRIIRRVSRYPWHYATGFLVAVGIQWASVILPLLSIVGVFVIPSTYFIGQVASALVLAAFWRADRQAPDTASEPKTIEAT